MRGEQEYGDGPMLDGPVLFVLGKWYGFKPGNPPSNHFHNLIGSLESTGFAKHVVFPVDEVTYAMNGQGCDRALYDLCQRLRPSLIVVGMSLAASMFERLLPRAETLFRLRRELGVPIVGILGDTSRPGFMDLPNAYTTSVDAFNVWDNYDAFLHEALDPDRYWPTWTPQDRRVFHDEARTRDLDVSFVGMMSSGPERSTAIARLREHGVRVHQVGGQGDACVPLEELASIYQRSKIVLNFSQVNENVSACRGRVFEATMCGAMLLEGDNPHTNRWLQPGRHYAPYRNLDELVFAVDYYLLHDEARMRIAKQGHDHVHAHCSAEAYWRPMLELAKSPVAAHAG
jgi:hypothetical protein